jgi:hypothetical protein
VIKGQIFIFDIIYDLCDFNLVARPLRSELADGYYHVISRGNNRQDWREFISF